MGQRYQVTGAFPIATAKGDAMPPDLSAGRKVGDQFDGDDLDPRTNIEALIKGRQIATVAEPVTAKTEQKATP